MRRCMGNYFGTPSNDTSSTISTDSPTTGVHNDYNATTTIDSSAASCCADHSDDDNSSSTVSPYSPPPPRSSNTPYEPSTVVLPGTSFSVASEADEEANSNDQILRPGGSTISPSGHITNPNGSVISPSGSSNNSYSTTTTMDFSATSSGAWRNQFSTAASEANEDANPNGEIFEAPKYKKEFAFADLKIATKSFSSDNLLGQGGFGKVYKGWLDEKTFAPSKTGTGKVVAIKKASPESRQEFQDYNAKICDFGLAKWGSSDGDSHWTTMNDNANISDFRLGLPDSDSHLTSRIKGTIDYVDPDYFRTGRVSVKSDVYGFGVVLLQLMTGSSVIDKKRPEEYQNLVVWFKSILPKERELKNIIDSRMEGQYTTKAILLTAKLVLKCTEDDPRSRPSMRKVLKELQQIAALKEDEND